MYTKEKKKEATEVQASKNLHAIYVKGLTSRDDATHFSTTCHNFGGFRQPRDVCNYNETFPTKAFPALSYAPHYTWTSNSEECLTRFQAVPKCKSVANMPKTQTRYSGYPANAYRYDPGAANLDAMTAFILARIKFYPEKAKEMLQSSDSKRYFHVQNVNHPSTRFRNMFKKYRAGVNNPYAADFDPADAAKVPAPSTDEYPGSWIFLNSIYDVVKGELADPGYPFCLTTLHWKEGWVDEVRSK